MRVLELFSGTGSVGKICKEYGWQVVSLDLKNADINSNILDWDYTIYKPNEFDIIWASPPCETFSNLRYCNIGRKLKAHNGEIFTKELLQQDIQNIGLPILRQTEKIIDYFKPKYYFIENPQTGSMKKYIDKPFYDVDYCKYAEWGYKKRTRIWTNLEGFNNKLCKNDCTQMLDKTRHISTLGGGYLVKIDDKFIYLCNTTDRLKYIDVDKFSKHKPSLKDKYRIPPNLIKSLFDALITPP